MILLTLTSLYEYAFRKEEVNIDLVGDLVNVIIVYVYGIIAK